MRVVVNISALKPPLTGIGHYTFQMLRELLTHPEVSDIKGLSPKGLLSRQELTDLLKELQHNSSTSLYSDLCKPFAKIPGARLRWRLLGLLQAVRYRQELKDWLYWEPGFTLLPLLCPSVVTFYDLSHIRYPEYHPAHRVKLLAHTIPHTLTHASRILTISHFTHSELIALLSPRQPIDIAYPGVADSFFNISRVDIEKCRKKFNLPEQFILSIGTLEPRKNLSNLVKAFSALPEDLRAKFPLVIAGATGWQDDAIKESISQLTAQNSAIVLGYVDQQYIPGLYAAATLTAYISFYEGFGMPVAESMASGTPVLTSNTASMPEVAAGSAAIIDPTDIHQISNKMEELLKNPELRKRMSEAGHERARIFTWKKAADILVQSLMKA